MTIKIDFRDQLTGAVANWNSITNAETAGLKTSNLTDFKNVGTGYSLTTNNASSSVSSGGLTLLDWHGVEKAVIGSWWYTNAPFSYTIGNLIVGDTYEIEIMSPANSDSRHTDWSDGLTTARYTNTDSSVPITDMAPPAVLSGVVDGTGSITITGTIVDTYMYLTSAILRLGSRAEMDIDNVNSGTELTLGQKSVTIRLSNSPDTIDSLTVAKKPQGIISQTIVGADRDIVFDLRGYFPDGANLVEVNDGAVYAYTHIQIDNPYLYSVPDSKAANSLFEGQTVTSGSKFWFEFTGANASKVSYSGVTAETEGLWANNVNEWITSDVGFVGEVDLTLYVWDFGTSTVLSTTSTVTVTAASANTAPAIVLTGSSTPTLAHGTAYSELGYVATDAEDGTITADVVVGGDTVDHTTLGTYTITYNVVDAEGEPAPQVTRVVTVTDQTIPVITLIGDPVVSVYKGRAYTDAGATLSDNIDADAVLVGSGAVNTDVVAEYTITFNSDDGAGNSALEVTRTVNVVPALEVSGTLVKPDGGTPANMTGLSMTIYPTAQDAQNNTNAIETLTGIGATSGAFAANPIVAGIGAHYMRLFDPLDYTSHAHGQIDVV